MRFQFLPIGRTFRISVLGEIMPGQYLRISLTEYVNATKDGIPYHVNNDEWCVLIY